MLQRGHGSCPKETSGEKVFGAGAPAFTQVDVPILVGRLAQRMLGIKWCLGCQQFYLWFPGKAPQERLPCGRCDKADTGRKCGVGGRRLHRQRGPGTDPTMAISLRTELLSVITRGSGGVGGVEESRCDHSGWHRGNLGGYGVVLILRVMWVLPL